MTGRIWVYLACLAACLTVFNACDEDDGFNLDPIRNADDANLFLETVYGQLANRTLFLDAFVAMPQLFSDNTFYSGIQNPSWKQASDLEISPANSTNNGMYTELYRINSNLNRLFAEIDTTDDASLTDAVKDGFRAEVRALRAATYYYLSAYWGGVPIIREYNSTADSLQVNATPQELFDLMESDLLFAEQYIGDNTFIDSRERITLPAVRAWLARLYLAYGDYDKALQYAQLVIADPDVDLAPTLAEAYTPSSTEHIWLVTESQSSLSLAVWFLQPFSNGQYVLRPRADVGFESGDDRRDLALSIPGTTIIKYDDISGNSDPVYMIRMAEMYLLAAEAAIRSAADYDLAEDYLNDVRNRAGLGDTTLNAGNWEDVVLHERNAELCYEGFHRLLDLRRFGRAETVLGPYGYEAKDALWPFPESVLEDFKSLEQNTGYN